MVPVCKMLKRREQPTTAESRNTVSVSFLLCFRVAFLSLLLCRFLQLFGAPCYHISLALLCFLFLFLFLFLLLSLLFVVFLFFFVVVHAVAWLCVSSSPSGSPRSRCDVPANLPGTFLRPDAIEQRVPPLQRRIPRDILLLDLSMIALSPSVFLFFLFLFFCLFLFFFFRRF
jgi:hypothetical protein